MLLLRAFLLELIVCFHVIGAAVLFRRLVPRESPWLGFILPTLGVVIVFNFIEHFIPLPSLGWLLPFSVGGLLWAIARPGYSWDGLRLPSVIFVLVFTWALFVKCMNPEITCNTEGVGDMARVLDFCLGSTLPPVDSWMPPYDHGSYYTFQHYGASLLKRLLNLDIGTGYNMGYTLLNTLTCLVAAGAAYRVSGNRAWVSVATLLVLLGDFTGSAVYLLYKNPIDPDFRLSIDIGDDWRNPARHNIFAWVMQSHSEVPGLRLFTPTFNLYFPEFHANLGGHFMTLASLLAANETFRKERSNLPWVCLLVFPLLTIITSTWFFIVVCALCAGGLAVSLLTGRRPGELEARRGGQRAGHGADLAFRRQPDFRLAFHADPLHLGPRAIRPAHTLVDVHHSVVAGLDALAGALLCLDPAHLVCPVDPFRRSAAAHFRRGGDDQRPGADGGKNVGCNLRRGPDHFSSAGLRPDGMDLSLPDGGFPLHRRYFYRHVGTSLHPVCRLGAGRLPSQGRYGLCKRQPEEADPGGNETPAQRNGSLGEKCLGLQSGPLHGQLLGKSLLHRVVQFGMPARI